MTYAKYFTNIWRALRGDDTKIFRTDSIEGVREAVEGLAGIADSLAQDAEDNLAELDLMIADLISRQAAENEALQQLAGITDALDSIVDTDPIVIETDNQIELDLESND